MPSTKEKKMTCPIFGIGAVAVVMAITSPPLLASDWQASEFGNDEMRYFFDAETVEKSKDSVLVWVKRVQVSKPDKDGTWATASRWQINCTRKTVNYLIFSDYDQENKFVKSSPGNNTENIMNPDSIGEGMVRTACKDNFPNDKSGKYYSKVKGNDIFKATKIYAAELIKSKSDSAPR